MEEKWIEIFKTGTHTDSSGNKKKWTTKDIDKIVSSYAAREVDAPAVIGHPRSNAPAYGWVLDLKRDGEKLLAKVKPTAKEFVDWLRKGLYRHVSMSVRPDLTLRHVGFLGAAPPAVKGLKVPEFADEEFTEIEIQIKEDAAMPTEKEFKELKEEKEKLEKELKEFKEKSDTGSGKAGEDLKTEFEEFKKKYEKLESDFAVTEEEKAAARKELKRLRLNARKNQFSQFLNEEVAWGALNEEQKNTALRILQTLSGEEFTEEGEEPEEVKEFKEFLKGIPGKTKPGEVATRTQASGATEKAKEFEEKVTEYMKANEGADYKEAVVKVAGEHPELYEAAQG